MRANVEGRAFDEEVGICWGFDEEIGESKQGFRKFSKGFSDIIVGTHS